jgi:hypothetical protein
VLRRTWRPILGAIACLSAIGEVVSAFFIEVPAAALVFAGLFIAAWLWLRRGGAAPIAVIGILCAIEALGFAFYERDDADDWVLQVAFLVLGVAGVLAAIAALRQRRPL